MKEFFDKITLKVCTLIRMHSLGEPVMDNECIEENCSGSCCLVPGGNSLSVSCKMVSNDKDMLVATG